MSCYTLFKGFQLPWPPSHCLYLKTLFRFLLNIYFNTLTLIQKEFSSPILLTKISPLRKKSKIHDYTSIKKTSIFILPIQSLRISPDQFNPDTSNHLLYPIVLFHFPCYPERNFRENQLLGCSISLSPL